MEMKLTNGLTNLKRNNMTAVEWFIQEFEKEPTKVNLDRLAEEAKEMEKQQQDKFAIGFAEWLIDPIPKPIEQFTIKQLLEIYRVIKNGKNSTTETLLDV